MITRRSYKTPKNAKNRLHPSDAAENGEQEKTERLFCSGSKISPTLKPLAQRMTSFSVSTFTCLSTLSTAPQTMHTPNCLTKIFHNKLQI